ncbi:MAG: hypothetical protein WCY58_07490 [Mariniphaga sp.]|nr:hypothetical protein [Mariniphaga sp.]
MKQDTIGYDSLEARPLPKWLTDQRDGLNYYQPEMPKMMEDHSLNIAVVSTGAIIIITLLLFTAYFIWKKRKKIK